MGLCNCWNKCCLPFGLIRKYSSRIRHRKIVLLLVGLDNSGKSCTANGLIQEPVEAVMPTVGFNAIRLKHKGYTVIIYDLGGGPQIRGIWPRYYIDVHGLIYVVDASDVPRINENRKVLQEILAHEKMAGKPVLLLANKQDREGALDELDIVEKLQIESLVNQQRCPTLVETCSAAGPPTVCKRKLDPGIYNGYRWLLSRIIADYETLNARVMRDTEEQNALIEKMRNEFKKKQNEENRVVNVSEEADFGNPFKPIQMVIKQLEDDEGKSHVVVKPMNGFVNGKQGQGDSVKEVSSIETLSVDSPDSCSQEVNEKLSSRSVSAVAAVKEQFEWKEGKQRKKRIKVRNNRTAPLDILASRENTRTLPPLKQVPHACLWSRPATSRSLQETGPSWELGKSLDVVHPPKEDESSDSEDVITASR